MMRLSSSEDCAELKDNSIYLSWQSMKWNITGKVEEYKITKSDLCSDVDTKVSVFFPSRIDIKYKGARLF